MNIEINSQGTILIIASYPELMLTKCFSVNIIANVSEYLPLIRDQQQIGAKNEQCCQCLF